MEPWSSVSSHLFLDETLAIHIITTRNQASKSMLMHLMVVQANLTHTGCMVPAQQTYIRVRHCTTTKPNIHGDLMQVQSRLSQEMNCVATILHANRPLESRAQFCFSSDQSLTDLRPSTLATKDESRRATKAENGFAASFSFSIAEHLLKLPNVLTIFTTQLHWFCAFSKAVPVIINIDFKTAARTKDQEYS